jgi:hypothetical protein
MQGIIRICGNKGVLAVLKINSQGTTSISNTVINETILVSKSRDGSVGTALGYGLDDRGSRVRSPAGAGNFSLHHRVQNGSGAHQASYSVDTRDSFPGSKAAGA